MLVFLQIATTVADANGKAQWSYASIDTLINAFRGRPCLWDRKHDDFKDRNKKDAAMLELSSVLYVMLQ